MRLRDCLKLHRKQYGEQPEKCQTKSESAETCGRTTCLRNRLSWSSSPSYCQRRSFYSTNVNYQQVRTCCFTFPELFFVQAVLQNSCYCPHHLLQAHHSNQQNITTVLIILVHQISKPCHRCSFQFDLLNLFVAAWEQCVRYNTELLF